MDNPRSEKVAVVDEVREKLEASDAALLTEYRGLDVAAISQLRRSLTEAGGEYKIYKNTLVRLAARDAGVEIEAFLTGPTAIAFVEAKTDGSVADPVLVAKAMRDFSRTHPALVVKGGLLGDKVLSAADARALADVAPRDELLARFAGGLAAPMVQFAGLLQALPRNFAYGLKALIDQGGATRGSVPDGQAGASEETPVAETTTDPAAEAAPESTTQES